MARVAIITDTVANLPEATYRELGVRVVPQIVVFGDTSYREGIDLTLEEFYERLEAADPLPTTSRPTPQSYAEAYEDARASGAGEIVVLTPSARLSGAHDAAAAAAKEWGRPVIIVDTKTVSLAQALVVMEAARLARAGASGEEIRERAEAIRPQVALYGAIHTLWYLQRTGRVGRASAAVGSLLQIKPILTVSLDGVVDTVDRVRTWARALGRLVDQIGLDRPQGNARLHAGVMHARALPDAQSVAEQIKGRYGVQEVMTTYFTPAVATHTGPGLVAVAYWWERL